jgi:hypothetical protein
MEELSSPPEKKHLKAPTFWGKYGKYQWIIIVVLLVVIGIEGVYIAANSTLDPSQNQISPPPISPTPFPDQSANPTANWKTYTNNKFNFSFSYPGYWELRDHTSETNQTYQTIVLFSQDKSAHDYGFTIDISIWSNPDNLSTEEFVPKHILTSNKNLQYKDINLNGTIAKQALNLPNQIDASDIFIKNGKYIISISGAYADIKAHKDIFDQILSTFTFTD